MATDLKPSTYKMGTYSPEQIAAIDKAYQQGQAEEARQKQTAQNTKLREDVQYTLFASGINTGRAPLLYDKNQTDDIAILFDVVTTHTYTKDYNKTSYAVESKAKASDHVVTQDGKFSFSAVITDSPLIINERNYIDFDTDKNNPLQSKRPAKAVEILKQIGDGHQLVTLVTEDDILTNYVITNFSVTRDNGQGGSIAVSLTLEEFRFRDISKTVLARTTADPKKAKNVNSGTKQTAENGSVSDNAQGKRKTPYLGKNAAAKERIENALTGTTDFSGEAGKKYEFDPASLKR
ncbi:hypothetical protein A71_122 [Escherichia phage A7_1]|uniref:Dit-like phage tail protein N-terminal domain-containing protein n=2 Tax=Vequintavirinae TaxID=1911928 RepID=A0AAE9VX34_9CAUD|nr:hypothetical protein A71_122 [Escherichia phage A7_1]UZZ64200.1 hypothetical protein A54_236 [Escherichia phage A5-4]WBF77557.1 hypothetical protein A73_133 [Escherichia phage A73]WBF77821.1 hypothetical protein W70_119 [Escherichia phage W70]